jgi:hypothetical protein
LHSYARGKVCLVLEDKAFDRIAELVTSPPASTEALRCVAKTIESRPLARNDDRSGFSCRQADLDTRAQGLGIGKALLRHVLAL